MARKRRSVPMEFPARGTVRASGDVRLEEGQGLGAGVGQGEGGRLHGGEEARTWVCMVRTKSSMFGQLLGRGVHHQVGALLRSAQVVVGDQAGDLDDGVARRIEPRHLEIDPGQHARACYRPPSGGGGCHRPCSVRRCCACPSTSSTPSCPLPAYAREGDAGADLIARHDVVLPLPGWPGGRPHRRGSGHPGRVRRSRGAAERVGGPPRPDLPQRPGPHRLRLPG